MSRFLSLLFLPLFLYALKYDHTHTFDLKKDEVATIKVVKKSDKDTQFVKFRWTLHSNSELVLLLNYDSFPRQFVLKREFRRDRVRIYLRDDYENLYDRPYLVLSFKEFDKKSAKIAVNIYDKKRVLDIKFIDPKK